VKPEIVEEWLGDAFERMLGHPSISPGIPLQFYWQRKRWVNNESLERRKRYLYMHECKECNSG
jgi:hypothetical protein